MHNIQTPVKLDFKCVVFDMDGTLVDSSAEIAKCLKKSYGDAGIETAGLNFSPEIVGPPIGEIIKNITPDIDADKLSEIIKFFRLNYDNSADDKTVLYEGMKDALDLLKKSGRSMYIATNKPLIPAMRIVNCVCPNYFKDIYTIDKFENKMSKSEMLAKICRLEGTSADNIAMVGDTIIDINSAKKAGAYAVGVLWGYGDKIEIIENADAYFSTVEELIESL